MGLWVVAAGAGALRGASQWEGREGKRRGLPDAPEEETFSREPFSRSQQPQRADEMENQPTVLFRRGDDAPRVLTAAGWAWGGKKIPPACSPRAPSLGYGDYEPRRPAERPTSNKAGSAKPRPPPGREGLKTRAARATRGAGWTRGPPAIIRTSKGTTTTASEEARARLLEPTRPRPAKGPRQDPIRQTIFLSGGGHEAELRLFGGFSG